MDVAALLWHHRKGSLFSATSIFHLYHYFLCRKLSSVGLAGQTHKAVGWLHQGLLLVLAITLLPPLLQGNAGGGHALLLTGQ